MKKITNTAALLAVIFTGSVSAFASCPKDYQEALAEPAIERALGTCLASDVILDMDPMPARATGTIIASCSVRDAELHAARILVPVRFEVTRDGCIAASLEN